MPQDIEEFLYATLAADTELRNLWGDPPNVHFFNSIAPQEKVFPYTVFQVINSKGTGPTLDSPGGSLNQWVYTFSTFAIGNRTLSGAKQAKQISDRISRLLSSTKQIVGFKGAWEVGRNGAWNELQKAYRQTVDMEMQENLLCT